VIIRAFEELEKRRRRGEVDVPEEEKSDEVLLLTEIRDLLGNRR
jgi:large-conductance mechanosensitive channel